MTPSKIHLHKKSQILDIHFGETLFSLSSEFLRVHSPSAEVKGHAGQGGQTPFGKKNVRIEKIQPAGNYALQIHFNDNHSSGLYRWEYLYQLGSNQEELWLDYLKKIHNLNKSRDENTAVITLVPLGSPPKIT